MPLDLVLDAVLLPFDVVAGVSGWRRHPADSKVDRANAESRCSNTFAT